MEFIERIPLVKVHYLLTLKFSEYKQLDKSSCKNDDERKINFDKMRNFCQAFVKSNGEIKRLYKFTGNNNWGSESQGSGRLFADGNGIQGLAKKIRGFLLDGITTDIDMVNAHPVILRYLCRLHNISHDELDFYIENRDVILSEFSDRETGKTLFLKALNDDKLNKKEKNIKFKAFDREMKEIQKIITKLTCYKDIVADVPSNKLYNWYGSAINRIMCFYENKILQLIISELNKLGIEICAPMFDGILIYVNNFNLLEHLEEKINNEFNGLNMKLSIKEHNKDIIMPDNFKIPENINEGQKKGVFNDLEASIKVFELYPHWKYCKGELYAFDDKTGMWSNDKSIHDSIVIKFKEHLYVANLDPSGKADVSKTKSYGNTECLRNKIYSSLKTLCHDDNWINEKQYSSLGKLLFKNGYFDSAEGTFFDKFNPDILFFCQIPHNFEAFSDGDKEYMEVVKQKLFYNPLGKSQADFLIINLSRGLMGDMMKRFMMGLGGTNCGKSIMTTAISLACGSYVGSFNAENLAYRNSSEDEGKSMRWAMLLKDKRLIFSNEMKTKTVINGNMVKKLSSGGDKLIGRTHGKEETEFITQFLTVCFANDLPKIEPYDDAVDNRLKYVSFKKEFVEKPSNEFELLKDPEIEQAIRTLRFQRVLVGLFIQTYMDIKENGIPEEPIEVVIAKDEWAGDDANPLEKILNEFTITNDKDDYVESSTIQDYLVKNKIDMTMKKFGQLLHKYCILNKYENVDRSDRKIKGKTKKVWTGIKTIEELEE
jgi:hypothetical protein